MSLPYFIARRYLFSKKSHNAINIISAIAAGGIAIATAAMVCTLSVFNGFHDLISTLYCNFDPELQVTAAEGKTFDTTAPAIDRIRHHADVEAASLCLEDNALILFRGHPLVITIKGVDEQFQHVTAIDSILYGSGKYRLQTADLYYGIPGIGLANQMGGPDWGSLQICAPRGGERINLANPIESFSVEDIESPGVVFNVNQRKYDEHYILTSLEFAQQLFEKEDCATTLEIRLKPSANLDRTKAALQSIAGKDYRVRDRMEQQADVFNIMNVEKLIAYIFLTFIILVACFNIISSLSMLIIEKKEDVMTLRNLGLSNGRIRAIFITEGRLISLFGAVTGVVLGLIICLLQQEFGLIRLGTGEGSFIVDAYPVAVHWQDIIVVFFTVIIVGFLSVWYPVHALSRRLLATAFLAAVLGIPAAQAQTVAPSAYGHTTMRHHGFRQQIRHTDAARLTREDVAAPFRSATALDDSGLGRYGMSAEGVVPSVGAPTIPVILVAFPDLDFLPTSTDDKIARWLNEPGYADEPFAVGSVADYFADCSNGFYTPDFEIVARVTVSNPYARYGAPSSTYNDCDDQGLVREAIDLAVAQGVDFTPYSETSGHLPIVAIIHAGPGEHEDEAYYLPGQSCEDYIWAHYDRLGYRTDDTAIDSYIICNESLRLFDDDGHHYASQITGIGTFCHEYCHALGLPDFYDVDGYYNGLSTATPRLWDVMDYQYTFDGYRPIYLNAYERNFLGWLDFTELTAADAGLHTLQPGEAMIIHNPANRREHFILEARAASRWHITEYEGLPYMGDGLLIWHLDYEARAWIENSPNNIRGHERFHIVPADGRHQGEIDNHSDYPGDPFPGLQGVTAFSAYTADFYVGHLNLSLSDIRQEASGAITFRLDAPTGLTGITPDPTAITPAYTLDGRNAADSHHGPIIQNHKITIK